MIPWSAFRGQSLSTNNWWRIARFFASSSAWRSGNGPANFFVAESDGGVSSVYRNALKYTRPPTIKWKERIHLHNSVSFIGSVERPPKAHATRFGTFGIYTVLVVKSSRDSLSSFRILIEMWGEMAEIAFQHLKPDDFICVSGHLGSYEKVFENGNHRIFYKVTVKGLNYVKQHANFHKVEKLESLDAVSRLEKCRSRLHLWQVFFWNPFEWYDCRRTKKHIRQPDFRHKYTNEALWLHVADPPWVSRQLQLHDTRMARLPRQYSED